MEFKLFLENQDPTFMLPLRFSNDVMSEFDYYLTELPAESRDEVVPEFRKAAEKLENGIQLYNIAAQAPPAGQRRMVGLR